MTLISCLMPVYNRYPRSGHLVEEAVESFLRQDWPEKELIICNDAWAQTLSIDHPQIRVFNLPRRFARLALKLRWMIEQARGELLCRWDDDDISLPWRLSVSAAALLGERLLEWHPSNYWYTPASGPQEDRHHGNDHVQALFRRELLDRLGGYPDSAWSGHEDADFTQALRQAGLWQPGPVLPTETMFYLYRWGVSPHHLSGTGGGARMQEFYEHLGRQRMAANQYPITPRWHADYVALTREAAARVATTSPA